MAVPLVDHFTVDVSFETYMKMLSLYPLHKAEEYYKEGDYEGLKHLMCSYVRLIQNGFGEVPKSRVTVNSLDEISAYSEYAQKKMDKYREDYSKETPISMWFRLD